MTIVARTFIVFFRIIGVSLVSCGLVYVFVMSNLLKHSLYYADHMPHSKDSNPALMMVTENMEYIYLGSDRLFKDNWKDYDIIDTVTEDSIGIIRVNEGAFASFDYQGQGIFAQTDSSGRLIRFDRHDGSDNEDISEEELTSFKRLPMRFLIRFVTIHLNLL